MGTILWGGLRQVQAMRDALVWTLGGALVAPTASQSMAAWLEGQGLQPVTTDGSMIKQIYLAVDAMREQLLGAQEYGMVESNASLSAGLPTSDYGSERSGTGWNLRDNFCTTSALVRLLGAVEQFELDTLKALFYYRPSGLLGGTLDQECIPVADDVVLETPAESSGGYEKPVVWTWLRSVAENGQRRADILLKVFRVRVVPPRSENIRTDLYKKRNAIAHGRTYVELKLAEYLHAEAHIVRSMRYVAAECLEQCKLEI